MVPAVATEMNGGLVYYMGEYLRVQDLLEASELPMG